MFLKKIVFQTAFPAETTPQSLEEAVEPSYSEPCLGCPVDLNKDVEGLDELLNTALRHVETERNNKHAVVNVLKIQQQVR